MNTKKESKTEKSKLFSSLSNLSAKMRNAFSSSIFCRILVGNENDNVSRKGLFGGLIEKINFKRKVSVPFKRFVARNVENSFLVNKIDGAIHRILDLQLKCIGAFFFSLGIYISVATLLKHFSSGNEALRFYDLYIGLICTVSGAICASSSRPLWRAIIESKLLSFLLFRVLGIRKDKIHGSGSQIERSDVALLLGVAAGILSGITSVNAVISVIPMLILAYSVLVLPECGIAVILLSFPFLTVSSLMSVCGYVSLCWILKLIRGKRTLSLRFSDVCLLLFAVIILFGGIVSAEPNTSFSIAIKYLVFISVYFSASNLIKTPQWCDRCMKCGIFSLSVTVIAVFAQIIASKFGITLTVIPNMICHLPASSISAVITLLLPILLCYSITTSDGDSRFGLILLALICVCCSVSSGTRGGVIAMIVSLLLFFLITNKKSVGFIIIGILCIPAVFAIMPYDIAEKVSAFFSIGENSVLFRETMRSGFLDILDFSTLGGTGLGKAASAAALPSLHTETFFGSMNTYRQITSGIGICGLFIFAVWICSYIRRSSKYIFSSETDSRKLSVTAVSCFCGVCGFLIQSIFDNTFSSPQIFMLLWLIAALTVSSINAAVSQRIQSYSDGLSIDISISDLKGSVNSNGIK